MEEICFSIFQATLFVLILGSISGVLAPRATADEEVKKTAVISWPRTGFFSS